MGSNGGFSVPNKNRLSPMSIRAERVPFPTKGGYMQHYKQDGTGRDTYIIHD